MSLAIDKFINEVLPRPQFLFRYDILFPSDIKGLDEAELVGNRVIEVTPPMTEFTTEPTPVGNSNWYYSLNNDIGNINMRILEGEDGKTFSFFAKWHDLMVTREGYHRVPIMYKKPIEIIVYGTLGKETMRLKYIDFFPITLDYPALTSENSDPLIYTFEFSGDSLICKTASSG